MRTIALKYLQKALNNPQADFRIDQWECVEQLLARRRILLVQRTGWGKSMVYFLATKLMREKGSGPTLLISPLLSLMRNQLEAAGRIGITARTINSTNKDEWDQTQEELRVDSIDALLISPERLTNESFRQDVLSVLVERIGIIVIDEAHCISDWGHDFRPEYRLIVRVLQAIPSNVPVLATTATANDRVAKDVMSQLGDGIEVIRGSLVRKSLKLQNINMPSPAVRMAWLAQTIPKLPGNGIIYTLTQRDAERLTKWLLGNEIDARVYHSDIQNSEDGTSVREEREQQLLNNEVKVLVSTIALGMGFDKPDLGFVIHFQRPASVVNYYQQVGRAGRAVSEAYGILLCGREDDHIANYFISRAFPVQQHVEDILDVLEDSDEGLSVKSMQSVLNLSQSVIYKTIRFLTVESPSPIIKDGKKWRATASAVNYRIDQDHVDAITEIRNQEQRDMQEYMEHQGCLMAFLQRALDDPVPQNCGKCRNCNPELLLDEKYEDGLANEAALFLKRSYQLITPRGLWPAHNCMPEYGFTGLIKKELRASEGRALSLWRDAGWGQLVVKGKYETKHFADELVTACVDMIACWNPTPAPEWVTCIPSLNKHPELVPDFAKRLAKALNLPFFPRIEKVRENKQQKLMENSFQQARNLDGVFKISREPKENSPCLLIDDIVGSKWTFTVASALLRQAGCVAVYPLALALNLLRVD